MASGYDLKEGKFNSERVLTKDLKKSLDSFFMTTSKKDSTYKYVLFKTILDNLDAATEKTYTLNFDLLYSRFAEIYWILIFKHKLPQKIPTTRARETYAEILVHQVVDSNNIKQGTTFRELPSDIQVFLVQEMKKKCSRYVFGALYVETEKLLYSFSKKGEWIKLNPIMVSYIKKHKNSIEMENYQSWGRFYAEILKAGDKDTSFYQRLLKRELKDYSFLYVKKPNIDKSSKKTKNTKASASNNLDYKYNKRLATDVKEVLKKHPDIGLYIAQIMDQVRGDKKEVNYILDNSYWCKKIGKRYYYNSIEDDEIISDVLFDDNTADEIEENLNDSPNIIDEVCIDENKIQLMNDPEELIKQLKRERKSKPVEKAYFTEDESKLQVENTSKQRKWDREEVVILVSEYFRTKDIDTDIIKANYQKISNFLKRREEILTGKTVSDTFRNFAGISMQSSRIRCLDPYTEYSGMQGTKLQKEIVQEYLNNPEAIISEAEEIYKKYGL